MSKKNTTAEAARYDAFSVREYQQEGETKADWMKVGVAFPHADRKGFRIILQAVPTDGVVVLRLHEAKPE